MAKGIFIYTRVRNFLYILNLFKEFYVNKYKETELAQSLLNDIKNSIESLFVDYMNSQYKVNTRYFLNCSSYFQNISKIFIFLLLVDYAE